MGSYCRHAVCTGTPFLSRQHVFRRCSIVVALCILSSCAPPRGDTSPTDNNSATLSTTQVAGNINSSEIGGSNLQVISVYRDSAVSNGENSFSAAVSINGTQLLFVRDANGRTRGLTLSTTRSRALMVDAVSTAIGLLFLSPGVIAIDPIEAEKRIVEFGALPSFALLVEFLRANLTKSSLTTLTGEAALPALVEMCINEWLVTHPLPEPDPSVMTLGVLPGPSDSNPPFQRSVRVGGVRLAVSQASPDGFNIPIMLENFGWRHIEVYKVQRDQSNQMIGVPMMASGTWLSGLDQLGPQSSIAGSIGQVLPASATMEFPFNVYKVQYWIVGPGMGAGEQLPDEMRHDASVAKLRDRNLISKTIWDYTALPMLSVLTGLNPTEIAKFIENPSGLLSRSPLDIELLQIPGATSRIAKTVLMNIVPSVLSTAGNALPLPGFPAVLSASNEVIGTPNYGVVANPYVTLPHIAMIEVARAGVQFSASRYAVSRADGKATVTVSRVGNANRQETVRIATSDGSAKEGQDYKAEAATLTFDPNETIKTFEISLLNYPAAQEDVTANLTLSQPSPGTSLGSPGIAVMRILADSRKSNASDANELPHSVPVTTQIDLATAIKAVGGNTPATLFIDGVATVNRATLVPSNVTLRFYGAGQLLTATGATVTIEGPIQASARQIFTGAGAILFNRSYKSDIRPEWWGAVFDAVTDDSAAWQAAIDAAPPGSRVVFSGISAIKGGGVVINKPINFVLDDEGGGGTKPVGFRQM